MSAMPPDCLGPAAACCTCWCSLLAQDAGKLLAAQSAASAGQVPGSRLTQVRPPAGIFYLPDKEAPVSRLLCWLNTARMRDCFQLPVRPGMGCFWGRLARRAMFAIRMFTSPPRCHRRLFKSHTCPVRASRTVYPSPTATGFFTASGGRGAAGCLAGHWEAYAPYSCSQQACPTPLRGDPVICRTSARKTGSPDG